MRLPRLTLAVLALGSTFAASAAGNAAAPAAPAVAAPTAAPLLDHSFRRLHGAETLNLRERYAGQPLLIVNTASHCGYTGQFKELEAVHQRYKDRGLKVLGFSSDDFNQEADNEAKAANVCFVNFGVTFDMFAPIHVRGDDAHPLFRELARQTQAPRWNFYKYVIGRDGRVLASFPSKVKPDAPEVLAALETAVGTPAR